MVNCVDTIASRHSPPAAAGPAAGRRHTVRGKIVTLLVTVDRALEQLGRSVNWQPRLGMLRRRTRTRAAFASEPTPGGDGLRVPASQVRRRVAAAWSTVTAAAMALSGQL